MNLFANTSPTLDGSPTLVKSVEEKNLKIKAGHKVAIGITVPSLPANFTPGTYYLVAQVVDPLNRTSLVASAQTISVAAPNMTGSVTLTATQSPFVKGTLNSVITFTVTVTNTGNVPLRGRELTITSSYIGALPVTGPVGVKHSFGRPLAVNATRTFKLRYRATEATLAGLYSMDAVVSAADGAALAGGSAYLF